MTDRILIRELSVAAVIGVHDWERETEQTLVFNVDLAADVRKAAATDDLADALDYSAVAETIRNVVRHGRFRLIETAAERVAGRLIAGHGAGWVRVEVIKRLRPGDGYASGVVIERSAAGAPLLSAIPFGFPNRTTHDHGHAAHGVRSPARG
ncbi:MAG: dihydroneopterin aldolase [Streptosporangiaceae bacterium]|nr:dihydroneopterin aldolase [Streptosporangiaceae bacterium]MBV9852993.1 dihydroneopterin aldolase [Streptosporangiaceae bacterium]